MYSNFNTSSLFKNLHSFNDPAQKRGYVYFMLHQILENSNVKPHWKIHKDYILDDLLSRENYELSTILQSNICAAGIVNIILDRKEKY